MSLYEFDILFHEDRNIVKDGMVSVEGDYSVCVTQAAAFVKVLYGAPLTRYSFPNRFPFSIPNGIPLLFCSHPPSATKRTVSATRCFPSTAASQPQTRFILFYKVFYTAQFRSDLHAAARSSSHDDTPSQQTADGAASEDDCSPSSDEDVAVGSSSKANGATTAVESLEEDGCGNVPPSASKEASVAARESLGDDTPSSVGWSESLSPYRFLVLFICCTMNPEQFLPPARSKCHNFSFNLLLPPPSAALTQSSWRKSSNRYP